MPQATQHELNKLREFDAFLDAFVAKLPADSAAQVKPHHDEFKARLGESIANKSINLANLFQILMALLAAIGPLLNPPPVKVPQVGPSNG